MIYCNQRTLGAVASSTTIDHDGVVEELCADGAFVLGRDILLGSGHADLALGEMAAM